MKTLIDTILDETNEYETESFDSSSLPQNVPLPQGALDRLRTMHLSRSSDALGCYYVIRSGDHLWRIAKRELIRQGDFFNPSNRDVAEYSELIKRHPSDCYLDR